MIKIKEDKLYYIAGETVIPLKQISENIFSLYPSETIIEFDETENDENFVKIAKEVGELLLEKRSTNLWNKYTLTEIIFYKCQF